MTREITRFGGKMRTQVLQYNLHFCYPHVLMRQSQEVKRKDQDINYFFCITARRLFAGSK
jgi:hypothetical protein